MLRNERLNDILSKQIQIGALNYELTECREKINQLIFQTSIKRQMILRIKRALPQRVSKWMIKIKRWLFGPRGLK